ncbi:MAG: penicillin-binding transpeptidase domain-containing protein, partial [Kiritimatiellae bacterium]|nr:penicillin-binding transpeptidase domain-containing protein [Kiritimatiellia bacterium]
SVPGFDPNEFVPAISTERWAALRDDPDKPLFNRAVAGAYAPGSIFKPVVAFAALESGAITGQTEFDCPGYYELGGIRFRCWYHPGHGMINVRRSLMDSCNVFFFKAALKCGYETVVHMAEALGLGRKTGIDLDYERGGLLPDAAWKRKNLGEGWRDGDTCNMAIGQGYLNVTPLQMSVVVSAIANGGTVYRPHLLRSARRAGEAVLERVGPEVVNEMNWNPASLRLVRGGMHDVVMSPRGTGRKAAVYDVEIAGKTGTAEYGEKGSGKKYAWMMAFAPFEKPQYAAVVIVEEGMSGGTTAAPLMHNLLQGIFYGDLTETEGGQG